MEAKISWTITLRCVDIVLESEAVGVLVLGFAGPMKVACARPRLLCISMARPVRSLVRRRSLVASSLHLFDLVTVV